MVNSNRINTERINHQVLVRSFNRLTNYGMSLSTISITSGLTSLFFYGMKTGGPVVMIWGWIVVSCFTLSVALSMAEICSSQSTIGSLYYWSGSLVPEKYKPMASWFTGWFNVTGQLAGTAAVDFGLAMLIGSVISLGFNSQWSPQPYHLILIHLMIIISHGVCNSLGIQSLTWLTHISTWWQVLAPIIVSLALFIGAKPGHSTMKSVFTEFRNETGWTNEIYVIFIGILQAQYALLGYDASAHMTAETRQADKASPWGMINAILVSTVMGWLFLIAFCFGIHDYQADMNTVTGFPITQILLDNFSRELTLFFMCLLLVACWFCGLASVTINSRVIYAICRDDTMPGSRWWYQIHPGLLCPLNAVWLSCLIGFILPLLYLVNTTAYVAITSLTTICAYIAYVLPVICKFFNPKRFIHGPFHLGKCSTFVNVIAILWVCFITILFLLPPVYPVTAVTMNYASVGLGSVFLFAGSAYFLSARYWFKGPTINVNCNIEKSNVSTSVV